MILDEPDKLGVAGVAGTADETTHRVDDPVFGILQGLCIEGLELRRRHVGDDLVHGCAHALIHDLVSRPGGLQRQAAGDIEGMTGDVSRQL
jgi:hypothetical protein